MSRVPADVILAELDLLRAIGPLIKNVDDVREKRETLDRAVACASRKTVGELLTPISPWLRRC